jgi:phosphoribosyl 1,2-cyclic phosphodiesterase
MKFCLLASGSKGNCLYLEHQGRALLVDCGLSAKETLRRLELRGLDPAGIEAIVVTHEHNDHTKGVRVTAKRLGGIPVMVTPATASKVKWGGPVDLRDIKAGKDFQAAGFKLHPFTVPHDAVDTVGLVMEADGVRLGLATDLGRVTKLAANRLVACRALIIESNHDPEMLAQGPYPPWLKQRIRGRQGHLSNEQGAELIADLHHADLAQVVLAHLSEENNNPELARTATGRVLDSLHCGAELRVAGQREPTDVIKLSE